jgi:hypothetical protein
MHMRTKTAMFMIVIMLVGSVSSGQGQQCERQGKQQTTHKKAPGRR